MDPVSKTEILRDVRSESSGKLYVEGSSLLHLDSNIFLKIMWGSQLLVVPESPSKEQRLGGEFKPQPRSP